MDQRPNSDQRHLGPQLLEALLNSAVGAIIIIDTQGTIQSANPATSTLFGYVVDELIGRNVKLLMPQPHRMRHDGYLNHHLATGERKIIGIGREVEGQRKDGSLFPMHLSVSAFLVDGQRYFAGIVHDLTARNEAKAESSKQQTLFKAIFENAPDAMIICDEARQIRLCNVSAQNSFGYPPEQLVGRNVEVLYEPGSEAGRILKAGPALSHQALAEPAVVQLKRQSGAMFPATLQLSRIIQADGDSHGYLVVIRDISKEMAREQALRQAQRMEALGQLTGGIAHDFNNLLTIITGNHELLDDELDSESQRNKLRRANDAALMGSRLTARLLTFARRRALDAVLLNLNEQVLSMMELLRRSLGEHVVLSSILKPDLWAVRADPSEIENAVLNLAINARDAMPGGGRLVIETRNSALDESSLAGDVGVIPGDFVCLSVSDTGTGMTPEVLARAFDPFFTTKEAGKGTGLGLSVIYGFARQSGGHVSIYSELGRGTTVNLYLPRAEVADRDKMLANSTGSEFAARGETILVVEDQPLVLEVTVKRLMRLGFEVIAADSAAAAIAILEGGQHVDLVFSDIVMPGGMTGFDLARWLRQRMPTIAILLSSGFADDVARAGERFDGDVEILRKPYTRDELASALNRALGGGQPGLIHAKRPE